MPTEINGYNPSEETALSSLIINEVDSTETFKKMKEKGLLQDNQLYLVTDEQDPTVIDEVPTEGSKNLVYSGGVYDALKQVGSADSVIEQNKGLEQKFWRGTREEFNAVETKSDDIMYIITDEEGNISDGGVDIPASDTEPDTGNYWLDTSAEGGSYYTAGEVDALLQNKADASSVYTKTESDTLLQKKADKDHVVNPNLIDNWYFGNPVNQRGQTTYTISSDEYTIDRWMKSAGTLNIEDGYISASLANWSSIVQNIEPNLFKALAGKTLTFSVLHKNGQLKKATFTPDSNYTSTDIWKNFGGEYGTMIYRWSGGHPAIIYANSQNSDLVAVKLELGDNQTLAHQDASGNWVLNEIPDYGEQLARCQRYFQTFATESLRPTNALDFRPVMRATPALSTITVGGKTLYTASADL